MSIVWIGLMTAIKNMFLKVVSVAFFEWLLLWGARMLVDSTKTKRDNEFLDKVLEIVEKTKDK